MIHNIRDNSEAAQMLIDTAERIKRNEEVDFVFAVRFRDGSKHDIGYYWHSDGSSSIVILGLLEWIKHQVLRYIDNE